MKKQPNLNARECQMLDLLAAGEHIKNIAKAMDILPTTARTYLSELYKKIDVANKTEAAAWWTGHKAETAARMTYATRWPMTTSRRPLKPAFEFAADTTFGDHALENGLLAALGCFSIYIGQNVRVAQMARELAPVASQNAKLSALHWLYERMMARDWDVAIEQWASLDPDLKEMHSLVLIECIHLLKQNFERPPLTLQTVSDEPRLLSLVRDWLAKGTPGAADDLEDFAAKGLVGSRTKHLALITLFFGFESKGDLPRAVDAANALLVDALEGRRAVEEEAKWDLVPKPLNKRATTMAPIMLPLSREKNTV